jgi:hypothetical protein
MTCCNHPGRTAGFLAVLFIANGGLAAGSAEPVHGVYRPDVRFPEFAPMWREGWSWKDESGERVRYGRPDMPLGGYLFVYLRNTADQPLPLHDVLLEGVSLSQAIVPEGTSVGRKQAKGGGEGKYPSSIRFSKLPKDRIDRLVAAGAPVWWKAEPAVVAPGESVEIVIRLRRDPSVEDLTVGVPLAAGRTAETRVRVAQRQPRFSSISFAPGLARVCAYVQHPSGKGLAPTRILMDGLDLTPACRIVADPAVDTSVVTIALPAALKPGSFHVFGAEFADGTLAMAGLAAWQSGFLYGMWGCDNGEGTAEELGPRFLEDLALHQVNLHMSHCPGVVSEYLNTDEGYRVLGRLGIQRMQHWMSPGHQPAFYFLTDEPDAADFASRMLAPDERLGSLAQWLVDRCRFFRREDPATPLLLNVDNTFKPENWYMYAQLADIACADPYYQEAAQSVWACDPTNMGAYLKPTYVYGVGTIYQSAAAPRPMHLILHTCKFDFAPAEFPYRGPTPEEKRVEVYYALASGAKQISYWWYSPFHRYHGVGHTDMEPLWTEIGLLGAEARTVGDLITTGCPARVPVDAPATVWCRSLLAGGDTMILLVVNDNMASDRLGTVVRPREKTRVSVAPPAWMEPGAVFEVDSGGTRDIGWQMEGGKVTLDLGRLELTRMVIITRDTGLRTRLQHEYEVKYADHVRKLKTVAASR